MLSNLIERINELSRLARQRELTPEEQATLAEASRRLRGGTDDSE